MTATATCECITAPASCGCEDRLPGASPEAGLYLTIATVPMQPWETPCEPKASLKAGTIFQSLNKPFFKNGGEKHAWQNR